MTYCSPKWWFCSLSVYTVCSQVVSSSVFVFVAMTSSFGQHTGSCKRKNWFYQYHGYTFRGPDLEGTCPCCLLECETCYKESRQQPSFLLFCKRKCDNINFLFTFLVRNMWDLDLHGQNWLRRVEQKVGNTWKETGPLFPFEGSKTWRKRQRISLVAKLVRWVLSVLQRLKISQWHQILNHHKIALHLLHLMKPFRMVHLRSQLLVPLPKRSHLLVPPCLQCFHCKNELLVPPCLQCLHCKNEAHGITTIFFKAKKFQTKWVAKLRIHIFIPDQVWDGVHRKTRQMYEIDGRKKKEIINKYKK